MKLFLNGQLAGETGDFGNSLQTTTDSSWILGVSSPSYSINGRFIGVLDDLRIYNSALPSSMAEEIYNSGFSDLHLTIEPYQLQTVQDPMVSENVSVELKFKKYGSFTDLNEVSIPDLNFSLPTPADIVGATLWVDSQDTDSVAVDADGNLTTWTNKLDSTVKLHATSSAPSGLGLLKGFPAIDFDPGESVNAKGMTLLFGVH